MMNSYARCTRRSITYVLEPNRRSQVHTWPFFRSLEFCSGLFVYFCNSLLKHVDSTGAHESPRDISRARVSALERVTRLSRVRRGFRAQETNHADARARHLPFARKRRTTLTLARIGEDLQTLASDICRSRVRDGPRRRSRASFGYQCATSGVHAKETTLAYRLYYVSIAYSVSRPAGQCSRAFLCYRADSCAWGWTLVFENRQARVTRLITLYNADQTVDTRVIEFSG